MSPLIVPEFVELDLDVKDRTEATRVLAERLATAGRVSDLEEFLTAPSKGAYFTHRIRNAFPHTQVVEPPPGL